MAWIYVDRWGEDIKAYCTAGEFVVQHLDVFRIPRCKDEVHYYRFGFAADGLRGHVL